MDQNKKFYIVLIVLGIILSGSSVLFCIGGDFPIFYHIACIVLDPSADNSMVYSYLTIDQYPIPQVTPANNYSYSMAAAYVLSPLALPPFYWAKMIFVFVDYVAYIVAVGLILHRLGATNRWYYYPLSLSVVWFPFIMDIMCGQLNSVLFLIVTFAALAAEKNKPYAAGVLLGFATLFKLYPLAIAMVLGLKNWRILVGCILTVGISFLIPDSFLWFPSLRRVSANGYTDFYNHLQNIGIYWFWLYSATIGAVTAFVAWISRQVDYIYLYSIAIPAVFLASPIVEVYHLTLLIFPYFILLRDLNEDKFTVGILCLSAFGMYAVVERLWTVSPIQYLSIGVLWIVALVYVGRLTVTVNSQFP